MKTIILSLPPTTNNTYFHKGHIVFKSKKARDWEQESLWTMKILKLKPVVRESYTVKIIMFLKVNRDIDSCCKIILDLLAKAGIYSNDKLVDWLIIGKTFDKTNPRIEIEVM